MEKMEIAINKGKFGFCLWLENHRIAGSKQYQTDKELARFKIDIEELEEVIQKFKDEQNEKNNSN